MAPGTNTALAANAATLRLDRVKGLLESLPRESRAQIRWTLGRLEHHLDAISSEEPTPRVLHEGVRALVAFWASLAELFGPVAEAAREQGLDDSLAREHERLNGLAPDAGALAELELLHDTLRRLVAMAPRLRDAEQLLDLSRALEATSSEELLQGPGGTIIVFVLLAMAVSRGLSRDAPVSRVLDVLDAAVLEAVRVRALFDAIGAPEAPDTASDPGSVLRASEAARAVLSTEDVGVLRTSRLGVLRVTVRRIAFLTD